MKELSIEQKARRYDEAIERANNLHKDAVEMENNMTTKTCEIIFPELKESEGERIRNFISNELACLRATDEKGSDRYEELTKAIDWLEKQGEQRSDDIDNKFIRMRETKPANIAEFLDRLTTVEQEFLWEHIAKIRELDKEEQKLVEKVEPKFKVGDWVVDRNGTVQQILSYKDCIYKHTNGYSSKMFEDEWRMWNVAKDAKDGDVLAFDDETMVIFKDLYNATTFHSYCHIEEGVFTASEKDVPDWWEGEGFHPATKEQRDLLFQKMKEAGYDWDSHTNKMIYNNDYRRLR